MAPASRGGFRQPRARPRGSPSSSGRPRGPGPAPATTRAEIQAAGGSVASIPRAPSTPAAAPASASAWPSPARKPVAVPPRPRHALRGPTERRVPSLCSPECSRGQFSTEENKDRTPAVSTVHSRSRNVTRHTRPCPGRGRPARPHLTSAGGRETHAEAALRFDVAARLFEPKMLVTLSAPSRPELGRGSRRSQKTACERAPFSRRTDRGPERSSPSPRLPLSSSLELDVTAGALAAILGHEAALRRGAASQPASQPGSLTRQILTEL